MPSRSITTACALYIPPEPTSTHVPIPHFRVVDLVATTVGMSGTRSRPSTTASPRTALATSGSCRSAAPTRGYEDTVGLRNSHDKSFPVGIAFGSRVFVCDNLAFLADTVIKRRHTANAKRDLPGLVGELIEPLALQREAQANTFERYRASSSRTSSPITPSSTCTEAGGQHAAHSGRSRSGTNPLRRVQGTRSAWRLFNAATFALNGRIVENAAITPKLHTVIDGVCERLN